MDQSVNPSFPVSRAEARAVLRDMRRHPEPFERPVIVAGGIHDPGFVAPRVAGTLRRLTPQRNQVKSVSFFGLGTGTFDGCRDHLIEAVERAAPGDDPRETAEVDVIAFSMGGIVARHAARPRDDGGKRLRIRRLFTISTPHRGARLAGLPTWDRRQLDLRPGSAFLAGLDEDLTRADYQLQTYTRLGDLIVGASNTAPPGRTPWWVSNPPLSLSHLGAAHDPRILADIARRLRGQSPLTVEPPAPPASPDAPGGRERD
ncbi:MAG: esterase/lipase family protein [Planctomycetota bacterium]|jgi:hypothetical protein